MSFGTGMLGAKIRDSSRRLQLSVAGEVVLSTLYQMQKEAEQIHRNAEFVVFPASMIIKRASEKLTFISAPFRDQIALDSLRGELSRKGLAIYMSMPRGFKPWGELDFDFGSGAYLLTKAGKKEAESRSKA